MNCTAFGLMTAVPLLFIHALLQTKTTELIGSLETAAMKFLNALAIVSRRARRAARARSELAQGELRTATHALTTAHARPRCASRSS